MPNNDNSLLEHMERGHCVSAFFPDFVKYRFRVTGHRRNSKCEAPQGSCGAGGGVGPVNPQTTVASWATCLVLQQTSSVTSPVLGAQPWFSHTAPYLKKLHQNPFLKCPYRSCLWYNAYRPLNSTADCMYSVKFAHLPVVPLYLWAHVSLSPGYHT